MGNYNAMSEAEIQAFLTAKGNCRDTRIYLADIYTGYSYHIKDGHFVCLAEETFGDGVAYGELAPDGESAAHVIWQAAQDYRINPQVLIVLLQKEQGLITDSWPNNRQFKVATGYGCPDTAPCAEQYFGFKNQVRKAAAMFRTVLDGGWTNYPLGENYIQYNPKDNFHKESMLIEKKDIQIHLLLDFPSWDLKDQHYIIFYPVIRLQFFSWLFVSISICINPKIKNAQ